MSSISTIKDVAARAGVAPSTVSKYINGGSVREKNVIAIREAIAELEFRANPFARNPQVTAQPRHRRIAARPVGPLFQRHAGGP